MICNSLKMESKYDINYKEQLCKQQQQQKINGTE